MVYRENFASILKHLRKSRGISQSTLSQHLALTFQAVSMMESGKRAPSFETLCDLADYFEVSIDYLIGRTQFPLVLTGDAVEIFSPSEMDLIKNSRNKNG